METLTVRHVEIASALGVRLDAPGIVAVIRRDIASATSDELLRTAVGRVKKLRQTGLLASLTPHGVVVVASLGARADSAVRFTHEISELISGEGMRALRAGIGRPYLTPDEAIRSFHDAEEALNGLDPGEVRTFERALLRNLVESSMYRDAIAESTIEKLRAYDSANDASLLSTLRLFVQTRFSLTRTARVLHVQPNSVSYRLTRVAAITGFDPTVISDMIFLALAVGDDDIRHGDGFLATEQG
ncbi:CdaR family transcriptional regulator [Microbacterium sp. EST19A]|uniref:PucR family transcriptional regulator n=1 Tax=Microbacterium sp. EST19A TaxID=2862681 RepID=UPI001CBB2252|nr:helix-turn-helix domain-containing protein [Microbacterium sp. EST19A]